MVDVRRWLQGAAGHVRCTKKAARRSRAAWAGGKPAGSLRWWRLLEADAVQHLLHLRRICADSADRDGLALEGLAASHGLERRVVERHALGSGPFVIAVGKIVLRLGT